MAILSAYFSNPQAVSSDVTIDTDTDSVKVNGTFTDTLNLTVNIGYVTNDVPSIDNTVAKPLDAEVASLRESTVKTVNGIAPDAAGNVTVAGGGDSSVGFIKLAIDLSNVGTMSAYRVNHPAISAGMVVVESVLTNPTAQGSDWTIKTYDGYLTIDGTLIAQTTLHLSLGVNGVDAMEAENERLNQLITPEYRIQAYTGDLNNILRTGFYNCSTDCTNRPSGSDWGFLQCFVHANGSHYLTQIWVPMIGSTNGICIRTRDNGTWAAWKLVQWNVCFVEKALTFSGLTTQGQDFSVTFDSGIPAHSTCFAIHAGVTPSATWNFRLQAKGPSVMTAGNPAIGYRLDWCSIDTQLYAFRAVVFYI